MVNTFYLTHNRSGFKISTGILFVLTDFVIILNDLIMLAKEMQKSLRKNEAIFKVALMLVKFALYFYYTTEHY